MHTAGYDLSKDIADAPHEEDVLNRFPVIGEVI
jgi:predicted heme/steroid binding protein